MFHRYLFVVCKEIQQKDKEEEMHFSGKMMILCYFFVYQKVVLPRKEGGRLMGTEELAFRSLFILNTMTG